jgi:predicted neuraminidase
MKTTIEIPRGTRGRWLRAAFAAGAIGAITSALTGCRDCETQVDGARTPVLAAGFINPDPPYPSCHASTIAETAAGQLAAAWFGGTRERHPDVGIWFSRFIDGRWLEPVEVATGEQADGSRHPCWNPVLFQPADGDLHLFYKVGPNPRDWWGMVMTSPDGGASWSAPQRLPEGIIGPVKNKPVILADGSWLSPSSSEDDGWRLHFERSRDGGGTWERIGPVDSGRNMDAIQPSILIHGPDTLQAVCRTRQGAIGMSWSFDAGETWTPVGAIDLPNPNSGTDAVTLADGRHLLIYNHSGTSIERSDKGVRYPLNLAVSDDGLSWQMVLVLENQPNRAGYAYPAVIQSSDGLLHIIYTWNRDRIKHVVVDPARL